MRASQHARRQATSLRIAVVVDTDCQGLGSRRWWSRSQPPVWRLLWMDRLRRHESWRINARQSDDHAHQLAAFDTASIRAFDHRVAARMSFGGLAVAILHRRLGHGGAGGQGRADRGQGHCKSNQCREEGSVHAFSCSFRPQLVNSRRRKC